MTTQPKEPLLRMAKRDSISPRAAWGIRAAAFLLALITGGLLLLLLGHNPITVYSAMISGAWGSPTVARETVKIAVPLLITSIGISLAFRMKFWNIGAEGQILVGGIATAACMIYLKALPPVVLILVMMIASLIAGAAWGFLPGFFKARWNTNETLFTLMMNYIAIQLTSFFVAKWEYPFGSNTVGIINPTGKQGWLPNMFSEGYNGDFGWNVLIVLVVTVGMYLYLSKSKHGYEIAVIGDSENTARYAGIRVSRVYVRTMLVSGAICGLAGFIAVSGAAHTISTTVSGGRGFTAIIVAWLAQFNSIVMVIFSFLLIVLQKGAMAIASLYGLSQEVSQMITGIILFFLLGSEFFVNYTVHFRGKKVSK